MTPVKNILVLTLMLLFAQTSVAVHDIHCLDGHHDDTCEIYFTQDHSVSNSVDQNWLEPIAYGEKAETFTALISPSIFVSYYLSRAPPFRSF